MRGRGCKSSLRLYVRTSPRHRWCTFGCEYLRDFSKKNQNGPIGILRGSGKLIPEKSRKSRGTVPLRYVSIQPKNTTWEGRGASNRLNSANCLSAMLFILGDLIGQCKGSQDWSEPRRVKFGPNEAFRINSTCDGKVLGSAGHFGMWIDRQLCLSSWGCSDSGMLWLVGK